MRFRRIDDPIERNPNAPKTNLLTHLSETPENRKAHPERPDSEEVQAYFDSLASFSAVLHHATRHAEQFSKPAWQLALRQNEHLREEMKAFEEALEEATKVKQSRLVRKDSLLRFAGEQVPKRKRPRRIPANQTKANLG
jgi:hypothetical protein